MTAVILCAAISLVCAAGFTLASAQKRLAQREFAKVQVDEAINIAIMRTGLAVAREQGDHTVSTTEIVKVPGGSVQVSVRAEFEGRKWNATKSTDVNDVVLGRVTEMSKDQISELLNLAATPKRGTDCVRSLFSSYGNADPEKALPTGTSAIYVSGGHDGQVWRLRAKAIGRVQEWYIRYTGDSAHMFAVITQQDYPAIRFPDCA
ncbi:hypothetical protein [Asticcacaulis sp. 201]|uniref:hypothetical protein n=1 Tax=Asticcacaulis sp. 201 TaxID=3028787 RepID=UPI0029164DB0|nr:hypothetical protein [Asticcacaulis sp. 201]MDV6331304.1 hypothetical protein [Asticcacaulis sp. 201]